MTTEKPDLVRNTTPDRTRNNLQIVVGTGDGCSTVILGMGLSLLVFTQTCNGLQGASRFSRGMMCRIREKD